jgi:hypothetical protein
VAAYLAVAALIKYIVENLRFAAEE